MKISSLKLIATENIISYKIAKPKLSILSLFNYKSFVDLYDNIKLSENKHLYKQISTNSFSDNTHIITGLISFANIYIPTNINNYIIYQCTIPKNSEYYIGSYLNMLTYASNNLIINNIL